MHRRFTYHEIFNPKILIEQKEVNSILITSNEVYIQKKSENNIQRYHKNILRGILGNKYVTCI